MDNQIPAPNPFLTWWFLSGDCAKVMREAGTLCRDLYRAVVAHRSGALAASGRVELNIGGMHHDRICADIIVGEGTPRGGYGAAHEYGSGIHPHSTGRGWIPQQPVDDFVTVLAIMDSMT